ncbi:MAG: RNA polymerase sigma24 factor [Phycisphaerae bacterium]
MDHSAAPTADLLSPAHPAHPSSEDALAGIVERVRAGDHAAFDELVKIAGGRIIAVCRRMLGQDEDVMDVVQDTFLSAFKSISNFDGRSQFTTWLYRIAVNACLMRIRTRRRRRERSIDDFLPTFLDDGHQVDPTRPWKPCEAFGIERSDIRDFVRARIDELPEQYRIVLMLRDIEELSTEETAEALGMTVSGVKTRLHRARQALRGLMDPFFRSEEFPA